jgi:hypothetical protein
MLLLTKLNKMKLTKKEFEAVELIKDKLIKEQSNDDTEIAHCNADDLLCDLLVELGFVDIVKEYSRIDKWYA